MASMKVRRKSRMSTRGGGSVQYKQPRRASGKQRRMINEAKNAMRNADYERQRADRGLNWNEVQTWLDEGLTLEEAKTYARTEI